MNKTSNMSMALKEQEQEMPFVRINNTMLPIVFPEINYDHAYIKEAYLLSPSYETGNSTANPDTMPDVKLLISVIYNDDVGLMDFLLKGVCLINLGFCFDLDIRIFSENGRMVLSLNDFGRIEAEEISYRFLPRAYNARKALLACDELIIEGKFGSL